MLTLSWEQQGWGKGPRLVRNILFLAGISVLEAPPEMVCLRVRENLSPAPLSWTEAELWAEIPQSGERMTLLTPACVDKTWHHVALT